MTTSSSNVARYLREMAESHPDQCALKAPRRGRSKKTIRYKSLSFAELDSLANQYANGMIEEGIVKGTRVLLMVRPGVNLIALVFALFKVGAIPVLIDPGMGLKNMMECICHSRPEALVAIPMAHFLTKVYL